MKKTHNVQRNGTRKGGFRRKKELALALCVSLWIAGGGVASTAAARKALYLTGEGDYVTISPSSGYPEGATVTVTDNNDTLNVNGGTWSDWYSFSAGMLPHGMMGGASYAHTLKVNNATFSYPGGVKLYGAEIRRSNNGLKDTAVMISNSTFEHAATIYGGTFPNEGNVPVELNNNTVTIAGESAESGTKFLDSATIYAGYLNGLKGSSLVLVAEQNTVNLYGATAMENASLFGYGYYSADLFSHSGNELHLGATRNGTKANDINFAPWQGYHVENGAVTATVNNTVKQVANFDKIVLHQVNWNTDIPVLKATNGFTNFGGALDISAMTFANSVPASGAMTLLSSGVANNFSTLELTYKSGTDTATANLDSTTPNVIVKAGTTTSDTGAGTGIGLRYNTNAHSVFLADNFAKVNYAIHEGKYVDTISLGTVSWSKNGTARTLAATDGYTFDAGTAINTENFAFDTPRSIGAGDSMTLLAGATGLTAGTSIAHTQDFTQTANGATLTATLSGNITRTTGALGYTAAGTALTGVNLADWNGTTATVPTGWTTGLTENSVTAADFTAPTETTDILTATAGFFIDDYITGDLKYASTIFNSEANGVTLTGGSAHGVKASDDGSKLVYHAVGTAGATEVTDISLGTMTWGAGRTLTTTDNFTFDANTAIVATNLSFTGTAKNAVAPGDSAALLAGATGLTAGQSVTGGTGKTVAVGYTDTTGIRFDATATGTVSAAADAVNYTVSDVTLSGVNLASWNGTGSAVPTGWTAKSGGVDVTAAGFAEPTLGAGQSVDIFTTNTANFFGTVSGAKAYTSGAFTDDEANGVTLSGSHFGGVKKSDDGKTLTYFAETMDVTDLSLGEMTWGTGRAAATGYDFANVTNANINTANLKFTNPEAATGSTTLLSDATNLAAGDDIAHTQDFTKTVNGATLSATLSGNVTREATAIGYTATGTELTGVNLANWNGTTAAVPTGWTANLAANSVTAAGFTAPTQTTDILTTNTPGFFNNDQITGAMKYATTTSSDTASGVTLTGTESKGVKASEDGKNLVYEQGNFNVHEISLGAMTWGTGRDAGAAIYNYANADIDLSKFTFENPEGISAGSTTLLQANDTLAEIAATEKNFSYTYTPVSGVEIDGIVNGSYGTTDAHALTYTATANQASKLTFGDVEWKDTGALLTRPANITFTGADVDTTNINFTNIESLEADRKMTLVSDFGDTVGTITGTKYTVGSTLEGTGKASLVGKDLIFTAETGTGGKPDVTPQEQTHNTVMGATVSIAALSAGNDFVGTATEGLAMTSNVGADGVSSYANMGGGSMRQETGSHVDVHSWNAIIALGHQNKKERGTFEYGVFFEYGRGNYTTYNGDERGDGSTHYTGGGLLAKWTAKHGLYVEGSLRAGTVHDDARNVLRDVQTRVPYSYETNAPYMGFHLGVGKEIPFDDIHSLDVYGKYFYNRRNGVSFDAGGHYDLDAVTSQVVRIGARYTVKQGKWNFYGGAAYEHELDGKAAGTADGVAIRGADTSGASFRGEIGATMKPGENSPWSLDLNVSGFAGKKQGFTGGVSVAFMF